MYYSIFILCIKYNINVIIYKYVQDDPYLRLLIYIYIHIIISYISNRNSLFFILIYFILFYLNKLKDLSKMNVY